jgi:hypothetical protein
MSKQNGALKDSRLPKTPSDDNTGPPSTTHRSNLQATNIFRPENTLPERITSPFPDESNRLSSPSIRALARQRTGKQVQRRQGRHGASTRNASTLGGTINSATSNSSLSGHANRTLMLPGPITSVGRSASTQAGHSAFFSNSFSDSSFVNIARSKGPVSRKRATPTKPLRRNQRQRLSNSSAHVKPFEKLETLEAQLRTSQQSLEANDDLRRLQLAKSIHRSVEGSLAQQPSTNQDVLPRLQPPAPDIKDLALGKLIVVEDQDLCSFCMFECNYGSSNEKVLLPASASYHRCVSCHPTRHLDEEYEKLELPHTLSSVSVLEQAKNAPPGFQAASIYKICE